MGIHGVERGGRSTQVAGTGAWGLGGVCVWCMCGRNGTGVGQSTGRHEPSMEAAPRV